MANNFIANDSPQKTLSGRLNNIIKFSTELRWLVGFFYFTGWKEVYKSLKENPEVKIRLLVGLQVGKHLSKMFEHGFQDVDLSSDEYFNDFMTSLGIAINNEEQDTQEFYEQVQFFLGMLDDERLIIRKTRDPNHAKLYLFEMNEEERKKHNLKGYLITGSSNLTRSGLRKQNEFNVEIKDYGYDEAVEYFEELWEEAIPITEMDQRKKRLIEFILHRSQAAEVSPYEAYAFILKTFLDLQNQKKLKPTVERLLEENGYKKFSYQIDAVNQALGYIEANNGVIIADVVGLGKSVIASLIARNLDKKGIIICPPALKGDYMDKTGWWGYVRDFDLNGWHVYSRGKVEDLAVELDDSDIDVVIVDEAHSFRNQDTARYEALAQICRGKQVILLTATPFNNSPADIFSLLKLFIVPGLSTITLENNLEGLFRYYSNRFKKLSTILKNYDSPDENKRGKAERLYVDYLGYKLPVDPQIVRNESKKLANTIKQVIFPVVIRRNRIDLKLDHQYSKEVGELSDVQEPIELFYYLSKSQSDFYDRVINDYISKEGRFTGAIYQPARYEKTLVEGKMGEEENRRFQQQNNLYDFMRRLLVKRFESSFGAFEQSIERFIEVHQLVLNFIEENGLYILDRDLIERMYDNEYTEEEIQETLRKFEAGELNRETVKNTTVYEIADFERKDKFLSDINKDLELFKQIKYELDKENLVEDDPKRQEVYEKVAEILKNKPDRKVIIFTEYTDTVRHLEPFFNEKLGDIVLTCDGTINISLSKALEKNFNAQYKGEKEDKYQVLITSDKLAEGFNLNRAGTIINYDIPWNPTRVIQRVGRINRIGARVYDKLYIYNFFPSEQGADIVKSREIAEQKMFMIHNALGEDAQIFGPEEEPTASRLYNKLNEAPEDDEEITLNTAIRNLYDNIRNAHPEVIERIEKLPNRVKTAKKSEVATVNVLRKKGLSLFAQQAETEEDSEVEGLSFDEFLNFVACEYETKRLPLSDQFWLTYERIKEHSETVRSNTSDLAIEKKAHSNLKVALKILNPSEEENIDFIKTLIKDIKHYFTMPKFTLRRLAFEELNVRSSEEKWDQIWEELNFIKKQYGVDYLERVLSRVENIDKEVIIAVENRG